MKKNQSTKIINKIQSIRSKNNTNWMGLLRLAFKKSPKEAKKILSRIEKHDRQISKLVKRLSK